MLTMVAAVVCGCGHYSKPASDQDYGKNSACLHVFISLGLWFGLTPAARSPHAGGMYPAACRDDSFFPGSLG